MSPIRIIKSHYESLAAIRPALRSFLNFSQSAASQAGLTVQQHQALLVPMGFPGRDYVSIAELAERLQVRACPPFTLTNCASWGRRSVGSSHRSA